MGLFLLRDSSVLKFVQKYPYNSSGIHFEQFLYVYGYKYVFRLTQKRLVVFSSYFDHSSEQAFLEVFPVRQGEYWKRWLSHPHAALHRHLLFRGIDAVFR